MQPCWNCGKSRDDDKRFCSTCGSALSPSPEEAKRLAEGVAYLLREVARWEWVAAWRYQEIRREYEGRRERLGEAADPGAAARRAALQRLQRHPAPPTEPADPAAIASELPISAAGSGSQAADPAAIASELPISAAGSGSQASASLPASGFLDVRTIRWFLVLGGLLLLAGFVGFLRGEWESLGRYVVTGALLATPALSFLGAWRLRESLPISSRLLSVVGGILLPVGLLALHRFGFTEGLATWNAWATASFALSALVLMALAALLTEPAALHLGAMSFVLGAGYLQRALDTTHGVFGFACLGAAFAGLALADAWRRAGVGPPSAAPGAQAPPLLPLRRHVLAASQLLAMLALAATLPSFNSGGLDGPVLFLVGSVFFATVAWLLEDARALYASGLVSVGFAAFAIAALGLPPVDAAFALILVGAAYLAMGRAAAPSLAAPSNRLAIGLVTGALVLLLGYDLLRAIADGFANRPRGEVAAALAVSLLGAAWFGAATVLLRAPRLVYGIAACLAHAELMALVLLGHGDTAMMSLPLALFPIGVLVAERLLRHRVASAYLGPALDVAAWIALLPAPLALANGSGTAWVSALVATAYVLLADRGGRPRLLYLGALWGAVAYASALEPKVQHFGLALIPLAVGLAAAALATDARRGRGFALPLARSAWIIAGVAVLLQPEVWSSGERGVATWTVVAAAVALGALARPFASWSLLRRPADVVLAGAAALLAPAAIAMAWSLGRPALELSSALLLVLAAMRAGALWCPPAWHQGLRFASLTWAFVMVLTTGSGTERDLVVGLAAPVLWIVDALLTRTASPGWGACAMAALGVAMSAGDDPLASPALRAALLVLLAAGWVLLVDLSVDFLVPAWLAAGYAWACGLHLLGMPAESLPLGFIPFNALLVTALGRYPWDLLERLACATAALVMAGSVTHPGPWVPSMVAAGYAAAFYAAARVRGSQGYDLAAWTLVPVAWTVGCMRSGGDGPMEWITLPVGAWLLLWSHFGPLRQGPALQQAGTMLVLVPSLLGSLTERFGVHTMLAAAAGLGMLVYGSGLRRPIPMVGGSLVLLAEVLLQVHRALVVQPWIYASVAGASLIALAILFERRRETFIQLGQRLRREMEAG